MQGTESRPYKRKRGTTISATCLFQRCGGRLLEQRQTGRPIPKDIQKTSTLRAAGRVPRAFKLRSSLRLRGIGQTPEPNGSDLTGFPRLFSNALQGPLWGNLEPIWP